LGVRPHNRCPSMALVEYVGFPHDESSGGLKGRSMRLRVLLVLGVVLLVGAACSSNSSTAPTATKPPTRSTTTITAIAASTTTAPPTTAPPTTAPPTTAPPTTIRSPTTTTLPGSPAPGTLTTALQEAHLSCNSLTALAGLTSGGGNVYAQGTFDLVQADSYADDANEDDSSGTYAKLANDMDAFENTASDVNWSKPLSLWNSQASTNASNDCNSL
jgi:hypothetical protein